MFKYIIRSLKNDKTTSITLMIPIIVSTFLIYFSFMSSFNINKVSSFMNENIFHKYNLALWSDSEINEELYTKITSYIKKYSFIERDIVNTEYKESVITVVGLDYKEESNKGFLQEKSDGVIINHEFAEKFNVKQGDYLYIKISNENMKVKVSSISDSFGIVGKVPYTVVIPKSVAKLKGSAKYFVIDVDKDKLQGIKKDLSQKFNMVNIKTSDEQYNDFKLQYNDIITGITILTCLSIIVCSFIIYHFFYMRIMKEQKDIGQMRSFGIRDSRCFHIYFYKNCILGLIGILVGVLLGMLALSITNKLDIFPMWKNNSIEIYNTFYLGICLMFEFVILTVIYIVVIKKIKGFSIVENLKSNQNNFKLNKFRVVPMIIGIILFIVLSVINIDTLKFYADDTIIIRMIYSVLEIIIFFIMIFLLLPNILRLFNKITDKLIQKYDVKSFMFPLKNFISNENHIISVLVVFTISIVVTIGVYCLFNSFSYSIKKEVEDMYKFDMQMVTGSKIDEDTYENIRRNQKLKYIDEEIYTQIKISEIDVNIKNINLDTFNKAVDIDISHLKSVSDKKDNNIIHAIVTSELADYMKWSIGSKQKIKLGEKNYTFLVDDIIRSNSYIGESIFVSSMYLQNEYSYWKYEYRIGLENSVSIDKFKHEISELISQPAFITDIRDLRNEIVKEMVGNVSLLNLICIQIMIVSFISVISILILYVKEQKNVFASMLAIGCRRNMIFKSIITQYFLVFIYAIIFSIFLSPIFLKILVACMSAVTKKTIIYTFNYSFCIMLYLIMFVTAIIIAILCGYKNIKIDVISTIKQSTF